MKKLIVILAVLLLSCTAWATKCYYNEAGDYRCIENDNDNNAQEDRMGNIEHRQKLIEQRQQQIEMEQQRQEDMMRDQQRQKEWDKLDRDINNPIITHPYNK